MKKLSCKSILVILIIFLVLVHIIGIVGAVITSNALWFIPVGIPYIIGLYYLVAISLMKEIKKKEPW